MPQSPIALLQAGSRCTWATAAMLGLRVWSQATDVWSDSSLRPLEIVGSHLLPTSAFARSSEGLQSKVMTAIIRIQYCLAMLHSVTAFAVLCHRIWMPKVRGCGGRKQWHKGYAKGSAGMRFLWRPATLAMRGYALKRWRCLQETLAGALALRPSCISVQQTLTNLDCAWGQWAGAWVMPVSPTWLVARRNLSKNI